MNRIVPPAIPRDVRPLRVPVQRTFARPRPALSVLGMGILLAALLALPPMGLPPPSNPRSVPHGSSSPLGAGVPVPAAGAPIVIAGFSATPSTVVRGSPTNLSVNVSGGTAPLLFAYRNLPVGCSSYNVSSFACAPSEVRTFAIEVQVSDLDGDVATATTSLVVTSGYGGAPIVTSFTISPAAVPVGQLAQFAVVAVSNSTTPSALLGYTYLGLPAGCATFNQTALNCIPQQSGTFHIEVLVTDGFGAVGYANSTLLVTGSGTPAAGGDGDVPSGLVVELAGIGAGVVVVVALGLWWRSRRAR